MPDKKENPSYLLRNIPQELWTAAKHVAIDKDVSLRQLILDAINDKLQEPTS